MVFVGNGRAKQGHNAIAEHLVHRALEAVHGVHHVVQRRVEELLGSFWVETANQFGGIFQVGKQHGDLLALAFQGTAGRENLLRKVGGRVGEWRLCRALHGSCDDGGRSVRSARPDQAAPCVIDHLGLRVEQFILQGGELLVI